MLPLVLIHYCGMSHFLNMDVRDFSFQQNKWFINLFAKAHCIYIYIENFL